MYPIVVSNSYFIFEPCSIRFIYRDLFVHSEHPVIRKISMWFKEICMFLFTNVSLLIVTMMNLDRCFVFAFAMRYYSFITKKLIIKLSVLSWILGIFLTYGMFFGYEFGNGLSCELMAFLTRNTINTIFRCTLICLVFLNLIMFGYLLHHIRKGFRVVHQTKTVQFSQRETRTVRKISVFTGMFLAAFPSLWWFILSRYLTWRRRLKRASTLFQLLWFC